MDDNPFSRPAERDPLSLSSVDFCAPGTSGPVPNQTPTKPQRGGYGVLIRDEKDDSDLDLDDDSDDARPLRGTDKTHLLGPSASSSSSSKPSSSSSASSKVAQAAAASLSSLSSLSNSMLARPKPAKSNATTTVVFTHTNKLDPDDDDDGIDAREESLLLREAKVAEKERNLENLASRLGGYPSQPPNWPSTCYPLVYHDIHAEVPERYQDLVYKLYLCVLWTWLCLLWNWFVIMVVVLGSTNIAGANSDALWCTVYLLCGVPGAWRFWYQPIYRGSRDSSYTQWMLFLVNYGLVHMLFVALMALGVPGMAGGGLFTMFTTINQSMHFATIIALLCMMFWAANLLGSVYLVKLAHTAWKSSGVTPSTNNAAASALASVL